MAHIRTVGIVGRGIIGSSWALVFARAGLKVRIWCRRDEQAAGTLSNIAASIRSLKGTGLDGDAETLTRVSAHASLADALTGADFVQELVAEDLALKHQILRDIEACTRPGLGHRQQHIGNHPEPARSRPDAPRPVPGRSSANTASPPPNH